MSLLIFWYLIGARVGNFEVHFDVILALTYQNIHNKMNIHLNFIIILHQQKQQDISLINKTSIMHPNNKFLKNNLMVSKSGPKTGLNSAIKIFEIFFFNSFIIQ